MSFLSGGFAGGLPSRGMRRPRSEGAAPMSGEDEAAWGCSLRALVEGSPNPLRGWDVDFLLLEVSPSAIPFFAPWWTLGGSTKRVVSGGRPDPFPEGMELANEPFTLRAVPPEGQSAQQVADWGKELLAVLKQQSPTGNPSMVPPLDLAAAAKQLAVESRMCSGIALARALSHPTLSGVALFIGRYGMKVDAPAFFNDHLMPALNAMADEVGDEVAMERFSKMTVDWATQAPLSGRVVLVKPLPGATHQLGWPAKIFSYPMFGRPAGGAGGVNIVTKPHDAPPEQQQVVKVNIYAAGWTHNLKGAGLPQLVVPPHATNGWLIKQRPKLQSLLVALQHIRPIFLGGLRVEVRTNGSIPTWPSLQRWLQDVVQISLGTCAGRELDPLILIGNAQAALDSATAAGVFSCHAADASRQVTPWRKHAYYRLLHLFGIVNARTAKSALAAEMAGRAWGNPAHVAVLDPHTGALHVNPNLPPGLPHIPCPNTREASASVVSRIGMTLAMDLPWNIVCTALHLSPHDAQVFSTVARTTKWRRFPQGRSRGMPMQFTATTLQGGGMIGPLGDNLMLATINLVALGQHRNVQHW